MSLNGSYINYPIEILEQIALQSCSDDLSRLSRTCKFFKTYVQPRLFQHINLSSSDEDVIDKVLVSLECNPANFRDFCTELAFEATYTEGDTVIETYQSLFAILKAFSANRCCLTHFRLSQENSEERPPNTVIHRDPFPAQNTLNCLHTVIEMSFTGTGQYDIIPPLLNASASLVTLEFEELHWNHEHTWTSMHEQPFLKNVTLVTCSPVFLDLALLIGSESMQKLEFMEGMLGDDVAIIKPLPLLETLVVSGVNFDEASPVFASILATAGSLKSLELPQWLDISGIPQSNEDACDTIERFSMELNHRLTQSDITKYHRTLSDFKNLNSITICKHYGGNGPELQHLIMALPSSLTRFKIEWWEDLEDCLIDIKQLAGLLSSFPRLSMVCFMGGPLLRDRIFFLADQSIEKKKEREQEVIGKAVQVMESCRFPSSMICSLQTGCRKLWQNRQP